MKYRKKPVEIEARQWDGTAKGAIPIINWILENGDRTASYHSARDAVMKNGKIIVDSIPEQINIGTLEGIMAATEGDFIIRGVQGEFYPCKPDIFEQTYDKVEN